MRIVKEKRKVTYSQECSFSPVEPSDILACPVRFPIPLPKGWKMNAYTHERHQPGVEIFAMDKLIGVRYVNTGEFVILPDLPIPIQELVEEHIDQFPVYPAAVKVTVGADPEYEYLRHGEPVSVASYGGSSSPSCCFGVDGAGDQIEIRPSPGSPEAVVNSIRRIMAEADVPLSVAGDRFPIGGHIHFGLGRETTPHPDLLRLLDIFIGKPTRILGGEARGSYSRLSAWESKPWGFEYRTPPAGIFKDPQTARIVLTAAKNVVERWESCLPFDFDSEVTCARLRDYVNNEILPIEEARVIRKLRRTDARNIMPAWTDSEGDYDNIVRAIGGHGSDDEYDDDYDREGPRTRPANVYRWSNGIAILSLSDEWDAEVARIFCETIAPFIITNVMLFGLRQERGAVVAGFDCDGLERITWDSDRCSFGIPRVIRVSGATSWQVTAQDVAAAVFSRLVVLGAISSERRSITRI